MNPVFPQTSHSLQDPVAVALDFWTMGLCQAIRPLGEITGAEITEAVLDRVFSRFCIGK